MRPYALIALVLAGGCASTPTPPAPIPGSAAAEAEVLATVDRFLLALGNHDHAAQAAMSVAAGGAFLQRRTKDGDRPVSVRTIGAMAAPHTDEDPFIERYWNPVVQVRGSLAQVWAPYELRDDGQVIHCGIDAFDLAKIDGQWKIAGVLSTFEPDACAELLPDNPSAMRPRDGWRETRNE